MLDRLKGRALLDGFRGAPAVDIDALATIVAQVSALIAQHHADIAEIDVNPLICAGSRIVAVDGLIVRANQAG